MLYIINDYLGQIGQKQIGQIHFCTLRFPKLIINNINILFIIIYIILTIRKLFFDYEKTNLPNLLLPNLPGKEFFDIVII